MSHLNETGLTYFQHLIRAWKWAFMLIVHGLFPNIWKTRVSDEICVNKDLDNATRAYLLKTMYGIDERKTPSIFERASDREVVARRIVAENEKYIHY
jgi:hypothetical protein